MYKIDNATAVAVMPTPGSVGPVPNGYFKRRAGSIATTTSVSIDFLNSLQEELCFVIEETGATLSKTTYDQLATAIVYIRDNSVIPPPPTFDSTVDLNNFDYISSNNDIVFTITDDFIINAINTHIPPNENPILGDEISAILLNGDTFIGFGNLATYRTNGVAFNDYALTVAALDDMLPFSRDYLDSQYHYGSLDATIAAGSTIYFLDGIYSTSLRYYPFSNLLHTAPDMNSLSSRVVAFQVFTDVAPGVGESYTFNLKIDFDGSIQTYSAVISGTNLNATLGIQALQAGGFEFATIEVITTAGAASLNRINYYLKIQTIPIF